MKPVAKAFVRAPASTSNLGPGFDCLGLALGLYNELALAVYPEAGSALVEISGEGAGRLSTGEDNLIVRAARLALPKRFSGRRLTFHAKNRIPLGRGLGSSAAAVIAGLSAANALRGPSRLGPDEILQLAVKFEGHPDNAAASLLGGLVVSCNGINGVKVWTLRPHGGLKVIIAVPEFELATKKARAVLPLRVTRKDAVFNASRALILASALERGRWELLGSAMEDRLHQPYRSRLVPGLNEAIAAVRKHKDWGAALSGAGSSIAALGPRGPQGGAIGRALQRAFARHGIKSRVLVMDCDRRGTIVA